MEEGAWLNLYRLFFSSSPHLNQSYVAGGMTESHGIDLIHDGSDSVIAVEMQYRLGLFGTDSAEQKLTGRRLIPLTGFIAGNSIKNKGALNAGLCA